MAAGPQGDRAHGWPITDCTAEGFRCAVGLAPLVDDPIPNEHLRDCVELILGWQNRDGGWASYERRRGGAWLEALNPSQVFRDIMVDYSYVECSSACVQALARARQVFLERRLARRIDRAIRRGVSFLRRTQRPDGGWRGSWGVCFTYGTWFAVWGLRAAGLPPSAPEIRRACGFLLSHQNGDGGWGESYRSCLEDRWVDHDESQVVNTAWALMTLARGGLADSLPATRAARFLLTHQRDDGGWPRQSLSGVFNGTTLINYDNYRRYFPVWALATLRAERQAART